MRVFKPNYKNDDLDESQDEDDEEQEQAKKKDEDMPRFILKPAKPQMFLILEPF
ncbi:MAG: hypothetical protein VX790_01830 [Bacteroidota bacterium]|nr:hypothetical protein [Bacteroidota bacterium]